MTLTPQQQAAISHRRSSLVVSASAGTGKTETLARRCLSLLLDGPEPCDVDALLVVTFTRAAAAELRARVAAMLRDAADAAPEAQLRGRLLRQIARLDVAEIGTIDAWCGRVVRENFARAGVDPGFRVMDELEAALLRSRELDSLFEWVYTAEDEEARVLRDLVRRAARPDDRFLRNAVEDVNRIRERRVDAEQWLDRQRAFWQRDAGRVAADGQRLLASAMAGECAFQAAQLDDLAQRRSDALPSALRDYREQLDAWKARLANGCDVAATAAEIAAFRLRNERGAAGPDSELVAEVADSWLRRRLQGAFPVEAIQACSEGAGAAGSILAALLHVERRFHERLTSAKRALGAYEFADVLRMALDVLAERGADGGLTPSPAALGLRRRYAHVLVDEYQDTSPVQAELLRLVSRAAPEPTNEFLVGDVKQCIYAFRGAEPRLMTAKAARYAAPDAPGRVLPLTGNFRSHARLLEGLNAIFENLFDRGLGGSDYGAGEALHGVRGDQSNATLDASPRIEIVAVARARRDEADAARDEPDGDDAADDPPLDQIEREAALAAASIRALVSGGACKQVRGPDGEPRLEPIRFGDVAILMRAASARAARLAALLRRAGVPAVAGGRESVLDCHEVVDACNALALLGQRRLDVPMAAYLRGPLGGLSESDLLAIRAFTPRGTYAAAVLRYRRAGPDPRLRSRLDGALERLDRWREEARLSDVRTLLGRILREGGLTAFAAGESGGAHRVGMLRALEHLAAAAAGAGRDGPSEFVEFLAGIEGQDSAPAGTPPTRADVVRVMTIHAAKGLEFPVVYVLDAGRRLRAHASSGIVTADDDAGLALRFFDVAGRRELLSHARLVADRCAAQRNLDEELRLLYVAATRARERLVIIGHTDADRFERLRAIGQSGSKPALVTRLEARSMLEWTTMGALAGGALSASGAQPPLVALRELGAGELAAAARGVDATAPPPPRPWTDEDDAWVRRAQRLIAYAPDRTASVCHAALSVSAYKQMGRAGAADAALDVARRGARGGASPLRVPAFARDSVPGQVAGRAAHRFLQFADLSRLDSPQEVRAQTAALVATGLLSPEEAAHVPVDDVCWFGASEPGRLVAATLPRVRREVPFVYSLPLGGPGERTIVRGVIDCLAETERGLFVLDYKTDRWRDAAGRGERVAAYTVQVFLYGVAAGAVFAQPVARLALVFLSQREVVEVSPHDALLEGRISGWAAWSAPRTSGVR